MTKDIKNILVTGGAGFIGSHVVDILLKDGFNVRVLDNLGPPTHDGNVPEWLNKEAEIVIGDVRLKEDWRKALGGIDAVIHLAAYMDYHLDFSTYIKTNIESIALMFEVIEEDKISIKKIISASSQSVYGDGRCECSVHGSISIESRREEDLKNKIFDQKCPKCDEVVKSVLQKEDDELTPQTPYGISKLSSEYLLKNLGKRYDIPVVLMRFSIVLGPHQSFRHFYSGALRSFVADALNGHPIRMNEDGSQMRDFIDVRDVANAHLVVLKDDRANFESFNVSGGHGTKIIDLAKVVCQETNSNFEPDISGRYRVGDSKYSLMDSSKLMSLGWKPKYSLNDSVRDYVKWVSQFDGLKEALDKTYEKMYKDGTLKK